MLKKIFLSAILTAGIVAQSIIPAAALPQQQKAVSVNPFQVSPEIKEALKEFSALAARLRVGINYQNYAEQVANLSPVLDAVPDEGRKNLAYLNLSLALSDYKNALNAWQSYIEGSGRHGFIPADSAYGSLLVRTYGVETTDISGSNYVYLKQAISKVWAQAQTNIAKAKGR